MYSRPWYKRYPADFIAGTLALTLEQKGAYSIVLDLIYDHGGPIPDDPQWIARVCGCSVRKWKILREDLIEHRKISVENGLIRNDKADKVLENGAKEARKLAENGAKGGRKRAENLANSKQINGLDEKGLQKTHPENPSILETRGYIDTLPKGNGADAPPDVLLYREGKELLGKSAGGQMTKLLAACGKDPVKALEALRLAASKQDPAEYVAGIIRAGPKSMSELVDMAVAMERPDPRKVEEERRRAEQEG